MSNIGKEKEREKETEREIERVLLPRSPITSEGILTVEAVRAAAETGPLPDSRCYCSQLLLLSHSYLF